MSDYGCLKEHLPKALGQTIYQSILCEHPSSLKEIAGISRENKHLLPWKAAWETPISGQKMDGQTAGILQCHA